jgi:hypothetical protein
MTGIESKFNHEMANIFSFLARLELLVLQNNYDYCSRLKFMQRKKNWKLRTAVLNQKGTKLNN